MSASLTTRITLACVGVALVAAGLAGFAAARVVLADERADTVGTVGTPATAPGGTVRERIGERVENQVAQRSARRVTRAVTAGLAVGLVVGLGAGVTTARVLTRPLRRTADAARALGAGRRDVRVPVEGPQEIAEVAVSLNRLAEALETSEARQRRFLLSVSHELRTPLTAVRGFGESIADGVVEGDQARDAARVVVDEAARLTRLVEDLLDLARIGADDFRLDLADTDVAALLDSAAGAWEPRAAAAAVRLVVERPAGPLVVRSDAGRLRQVLDGLAANALRLTPEGGSVVLAARAAPGGGAVLEVRDSGPGLTAEDRAVAFEPGALGARYRDERPVGVGIGLSLVHGLVQRLGGGIAVGVAREGGAAFTVTLPRS